MSAQGGTLQRRGTIEMPIWPVAALAIVVVAAAIGMTLVRGAGETRFVTSITDSQRLANSSAAIREQGAVAPTIDLTNSGAAIRARGYAIGLGQGFMPTAAIREQGATLPVVVGISHVTPRLSAPSPAEVAPAVAGPSTGIMVNGEICHQCR